MSNPNLDQPTLPKDWWAPAVGAACVPFSMLMQGLNPLLDDPPGVSWGHLIMFFPGLAFAALVAVLIVRQQPTGHGRRWYDGGGWWRPLLGGWLTSSLFGFPATILSYIISSGDDPMFLVRSVLNPAAFLALALAFLGLWLIQLRTTVEIDVEAGTGRILKGHPHVRQPIEFQIDDYERITLRRRIIRGRRGSRYPQWYLTLEGGSGSPVEFIRSGKIATPARLGPQIAGEAGWEFVDQG